MDSIEKSSTWSRFCHAAAMLGAVAVTTGFTLGKAPMLTPDGPIAEAERNLLLSAVGLMLIVVVPVFLLVAIFTWHYRGSNDKATYTPDWSYSARIDAVIWLVPALLIAILGYLVWHYTHKLDPYRRIASNIPPLEVEVVAQDWKWLFLYPEQNIAVVNELVFPSGRPLSLRITSDTVINSFMIPTLGGQIYAMAGMQTRLNLLANGPGHFMGRNVQFSGEGFPDQHFAAIATTPQEFDTWVIKVKQSKDRLDNDTYRALAKPSSKHPVTYYSAVEPDLFDRIIAKYVGNLTSEGGSFQSNSSVEAHHARQTNN